MSVALNHKKPIKIESQTHLSLADGKILILKIIKIGLCVKKVGDNALNILLPLIDKMILVKLQNLLYI